MVADYDVLQFFPFNPVDKKTVARVRMPDGRQLWFAKGAPQVGCNFVGISRTLCTGYVVGVSNMRDASSIEHTRMYSMRSYGRKLSADQ